MKTVFASLSALAFALPASLSATSAAVDTPVIEKPVEQSQARIDYSYWDEALKFFVYRMGRSDRTSARPVQPITGTKFVYGHDSRLRMEGNRVAFSFLDAEQIAAISAYRRDLESVADQVDITALPRNEQLAYWFNLHNVAVIEQIALAYPVRWPSRITLGPDKMPLDEAKFITVGGTQLSPRDIRTEIVYQGWQDPRVIYGFFRGEIGGPSIPKSAFTADNISGLLDEAAYEFVNSLRGTERRGQRLHISKVYDEAASALFPDFQRDMRAHLVKYSTEKVRREIEQTNLVETSIWEADIADLAGAEKDPELSQVAFNLDPRGWGFDHLTGPLDIPGIPRNVARLVQERNAKFQRMLRRGEFKGRVIVLPQDYDPGAEVE